ncbi:endonuclease/exonuclease/phosphatase family protein [Candidatus Obscuribacterales bacterium]|nr:endonuclease/exonuclease/phosphatase family protein [Candidatus Obscuribacterales bacterium]
MRNRKLQIVGIAITFVAGALTAVAALESVWWLPYLVAQFRIQIAIGAVVAAIALAVSKQTRIAAVLCMIFAMCNATCFMPAFLPNGNHHAHNLNKAHSISLLMLNVNNKNERFVDAIKYIESVNPDVLLISELTPDWETALNQMHEFKYSCTVPRLDTYGIAVYSKKKLLNPKIKYYGSSGHPSILCQLDADYQPVTLLHTHVQGPIKHRHFLWQKEQFKIMTKEAAKLPKPLIVTGDMNSTPWTHMLAGLAKKSQLLDTRNGYGLQLSWPAPMIWRKTPVVLLPIDHCFASKDIAVLDRKVGPFIGSDHYPVFISLGL